MAFAKAKTALAQLEEKLRRQLGLAGEVGATFEPRLQPVIIAGDLRDAGVASHVGRNFAWMFSATGTNGVFSLRNETEIFVDRIHFATSVATQLSAYVTVPGQAPAIAVATLAGTWCDRKVIAGDQVPLTQTNAVAFGALTGTAISDQNRLVSAFLAASATFTFEVNIMLPALSHLNFVGNGAGLGAVGIRGRIWP